ncbi:hypothetical protein LCGC14_2465930 [marine sediment metagenome]|uniref:Uncharacterized protein n=1 Tax=marine sediment metagenome TaxID=412755 RepID=A0A0F9DNZ5_9ZZZZ
MPRKNPVKKEYVMKDNGKIFHGKAVKAAKKLDGRIKDYLEMCASSQWAGKEYTKPGRMKIK